MTGVRELLGVKSDKIFAYMMRAQTTRFHSLPDLEKVQGKKTGIELHLQQQEQKPQDFIPYQFPHFVLLTPFSPLYLR